MSMLNKNLFQLLGNDVEDDSIVSLPPKEIVKKSTSSKKEDVPPPSADKSRAKKQRSPVSANDAALKKKADNRGKPAPSTTSRKTTKPAFDKQSKTGKVDTAKTVKKGWGDDANELQEEEAAAKDAEDEEASVDAEEAAPVVPKKSLQDYFEELKIKQESLSATPTSARKPNQGAEDKWVDGEKLVKEQEIFVAPTATKKLRTKQPKEIQFFEFDATFSDEVPKNTSSSSRGGNSTRGSRGSSRGGRGGKPTTGKKPVGKAASGSKKPVVIDDSNFPSL